MEGFPKRIATKQDFENVQAMVEAGQLSRVDFNSYLKQLHDSIVYQIPILERTGKSVIIPHNPILTVSDIIGLEVVEIKEARGENTEDVATEIILANEVDVVTVMIKNKESELERLDISISEVAKLLEGGENNEILS